MSRETQARANVRYRNLLFEALAYRLAENDDEQAELLGILRDVYCWGQEDARLAMGKGPVAPFRSNTPREVLEP